MTIPAENLRMILRFVDKFNLVEIQVATNQRVHQLHPMGVISGKEQLQSLLEQTGIDHWIDFSKESTAYGPVAVAVAITPKEIIVQLERHFRKEEALRIEIIDRGEKCPWRSGHCKHSRV